jgi:peptide-methionine (R)-S-oxide reductase
MLHPLPRLAVALALAAPLFSTGCDRSRVPPRAASTDSPMAPNDEDRKPVTKTDAEWRAQLTPEQYRVMRQKGTEPAFSGKYWDTHDAGTYRCASCGAILFRSDDKFDSGCGWPSFDKGAPGAGITENHDSSFGWDRTEVVCTRCGAHLGHVFDDGPTPTHLRYCINSASIDLQKKADAGKDAEKKAGAKKSDPPAPATPSPSAK